MNEAENDQALTALENFAIIMATYYQKLIANGMPEGLAQVMTLAYQQQWLDRIKLDSDRLKK